MTGFGDKLKLKEQAEEDIYFARRDRELIAALQRGKSNSDQQLDPQSADPRKPSPGDPNGSSQMQLKGLFPALSRLWRRIWN